VECYRNVIAKRRSRSTWAEVNLEYYSRISRAVLRIEEFSFLEWKVVRRIKDAKLDVCLPTSKPSLPRLSSPGSYASVRLRITVTARQYQNTGTRLTIPSLHRYPTQNTLASDSHSEALYCEGEVAPDRASLCVVELIDDMDDTVHSMIAAELYADTKSMLLSRSFLTKSGSKFAMVQNHALIFGTSYRKISRGDAFQYLQILNLVKIMELNPKIYIKHKKERF
ncbi:hypothetical protein ALC53_02881, partial [Atta colombica]